ncbi:hypothetical protein [Curtobacterium sp. 458]|uniref:hypothetical protein n=1 Tax=Curtobacterium sp. 458 TaxID=3050069 RepID=UPI0025B40F05|nr:hypothetical protein [Curtobacterium sp. 458]WJY01566.1 hypothetical protein QPJ90_07670 [Curtobacterium sp. 458]
MPVPWMERTGRTPGGVVGAWFNVVVCAVLVVGLPIAALSRGQGAVHIAFAVVLTAVALGMEVLFVRNLRQQLARRRGE